MESRLVFIYGPASAALSAVGLLEQYWPAPSIQIRKIEKAEAFRVKPLLCNAIPNIESEVYRTQSANMSNASNMPSFSCSRGGSLKHKS